MDHYQHWTTRFQTSYELAYVLNDGAIHPNHFGHLELARLILDKLGIFDPAARTCRMFVP